MTTRCFVYVPLGANYKVVVTFSDAGAHILECQPGMFAEYLIWLGRSATATEVPLPPPPPSVSGP